MARFIAVLLCILIIQPALPYENNAEAFVARILYQSIMEREAQSRITYYPKPKERIHCKYENEYCNDVSEGEGPQALSMDFPSLDKELIVVICEGEQEQYNCSQLNNNKVEFFHDY
jgi:hypothetical protein